MKTYQLATAVFALTAVVAGATEYVYTTYDQPFPLYTELTSASDQTNNLGHTVATATFERSPWWPQFFLGFSLNDGISTTLVRSPWSGAQASGILINDVDQVVGRIYFPSTNAVGYPGNPTAIYTGMNVGGPDGSYFWSAGTFTIIPGRDTHMEDMNKLGQVVGAQDGGYPEKKRSSGILPVRVLFKSWPFQEWGRMSHRWPRESRMMARSSEYIGHRSLTASLATFSQLRFQSRGARCFLPLVH